MKQIEREIKILNVDVNKIKAKMKEKGILPKGKFIQDVYAFDLPSVDELYIKYVNIFLQNNDKRGLEKLIIEIRPCFDEDDIKLIESILGTEDILDYINNSDSNYDKLNSNEIINLMKKANNNFSKWVRLRKTGDETTITIKKIVSNKGKYKLDAVDELEFVVPSILEGKQLLEDLGYFFNRHQIKFRIAYDYKNTEIVIDKWPMLNPYVEIEGPSKEEILEAVLMLGYNIDDAVVMNTDDVYEQIGINVYDAKYKDLIFNAEELIEIDSYMK